MNNEIEELHMLAIKRDPTFYSQFQNLNSEYIKKLLGINPHLQNNELQLLAYLYLNFQTKEIAEMLFLSPKTIQNRRHSIRKKLGISPSEDIYIWLKSL